VELKNDQPMAPKVTVLTPTFNRPDYLKDTIDSVISQAQQNWEMIIINDGGIDVKKIVEDFKDPRLRYYNRRKNRGKASCLNFALERAKGEYIAYIDDDDIWYPNHLEVLSKALDNNPEIGAVYSDLYAVFFLKDKSLPKRYTIHKYIQVSRDYNRDFMFYFNHTLHVSLMHRKDLALKAGGYDENISVLIDWNITRKLSFFTDFKYIPVPTGEYYMPVGKSDRISYLERQSKKKYLHNLRKIKADLPPEPWLKVDKIAVVFPVYEWSEGVVKMITGLIDILNYPVTFCIVNNDIKKDEDYCRRYMGDIGALKNLHIHTPDQRLSVLEAYRFGAENIDCEYLYLPSYKVDLSKEFRLISGRCLLEKSEFKSESIKWDIDQEKNGPWDILLKKNIFMEKTHPDSNDMTIFADFVKTIPDSLKCDFLLTVANKNYNEGNYKLAYRLIKEAEMVKTGGTGDQFLVRLYSNICYSLNYYDEAEEKCKDLIERGYGADNWVRLGEILQTREKYDEAINAYQKGLKDIGLTTRDLEASVFPIFSTEDPGAFTAMIGLGECYYRKGDFTSAAKLFRKASKLSANSYRTYLGFGRLFLETGNYMNAEESFVEADKRKPEDPEIYREFGKLYLKKNQCEKSYEYFCRAFHFEPESVSNLSFIFETGSSLGKWDEVKRLLVKFLEHRPGNIQGIKYLAELYKITGEYLKAESLVEKGLLFIRDDVELNALYHGIQQSKAGYQPGV